MERQLGAHAWCTQIDWHFVAVAAAVGTASVVGGAVDQASEGYKLVIVVASDDTVAGSDARDAEKVEAVVAAVAVAVVAVVESVVHS